ncbi:D-threo-aldose 1-dehydrogenase [Brevibacterium siliguriense]|uniref:D-threo-aldose 1-dehydrogenase n=1 Tax=Brevibacterium siliguriense TaxID=1136497 RepID=A0A1H1LBD1_9MICO|nr:aldo/keto reductase [Brevibacterium siliguriense]SDR71179.1 D-threo-aldose 1-dehydrogenase [Brevibacterium siliguriense]
MTIKNPVVRRLHDQRKLGFGGAPIGNLYRSIDDETAVGTVTEAWDQGIRYFDTAPHYGLGLSERRIGEVLSDRPRDEFLLSTKVGRLIRPADQPRQLDDEGFAVPGDRVRVRDYSGDGIRRSIEESLERLGLAKIDIVFIHDPDDFWTEAIDGAVPMLNQLRDEGIIGAWGAGMNQAEMLARFVRETDIDLVMQAGRYTLLEQGGREELIPECERRGVGIVNVGVFNSGILANEDPLAQAKYNYEDAPAPIVEKAQNLAELAASHGTTLPAAALAFSYRDPAVTNVTVGMRTAAQVRRNTDLFRQPVPDAFWTDAVAAGLLAVDPKSFGE